MPPRLRLRHRAGSRGRFAVIVLRRAPRFARALPQRLSSHLVARLALARPPGREADDDRDARGPRPLVVASYNVHKCVGTDRRFDPARVGAVIAELGADLVALQEADRRFGRRTGLLDAAALERATGLRLVPVSELHDGHGWHGNALLVRGDARVERVQRVALPGAEPRGAVMAEIAFAAGRLRVVATHLGLLRSSRVRQAELLLRLLSRAEPMPTLMMGDFNEWRPGRSVLRVMEPFFGRDRGGPASFPSRRPLLALDRMLCWPFGALDAVRAHDSPAARVASDHLPLRGRLDLAGATRALLPPAEAAIEAAA